MTATLDEAPATTPAETPTPPPPPPPAEPPTPPAPVPVDLSDYFTEAQIQQFLAPIRRNRISVKEGQSHLEAYDVRAHLNRCLGFGRWSGDVIDSSLLFEEIEGEKVWNPDKKGYGGKSKPGWDDNRRVSVAYRVRYRLTVCAPNGQVLATYTEEAMGDAINFPGAKRMGAHDFAIKTAESQALKRCAMNLGDQFGLSLYARGSLNAVVGGTHVHAEQVPVTAAAPAVKSIDEGMAAVVAEVAPEHADLPTGEDPAEAGVDPATGEVPATNPQPAERAQQGDPRTEGAGGWQGIDQAGQRREQRSQQPAATDLMAGTVAERLARTKWTAEQFAERIAGLTDDGKVQELTTWLGERGLLDVEVEDYTLGQRLQGRRDWIRDEARKARSSSSTRTSTRASAPASAPAPAGGASAAADPPETCQGAARKPTLDFLATLGWDEAKVAQHFGRPVETVATQKLAKLRLDLTATSHGDTGAGGEGGEQS